jgi:hypothetical protein
LRNNASDGVVRETKEKLGGEEGQEPGTKTQERMRRLEAEQFKKAPYPLKRQETILGLFAPPVRINLMKL